MDILDRLRSIQNDCAQYIAGSDIMRDAANEIDQITATRTALAAAEADNERLRNALNEILTTDWVSDRVRRTAKTAIAQPRDDSALREMIAGVYAECAKACRKEAVVIVVDGKEERAYNNAVSDCEEAIRALAEKARHGS